MAPDVFKSIQGALKEAQMLRLGPSGANLYFCTDYMGPQHSDVDVTWALTCQLQKADLDVAEFNFCFTRWRVFIQTEPRTVW